MTGLEGAACRAPLAQAEQVTPHLFLTEQIGRAAVMRRQPAHRLDVELPRPLSQSGQDHVLDHPRTLWRHGGLLSVMVRRAASRPPTRKDTPACHLPRPCQLHASLGEAVPSNSIFVAHQHSRESGKSTIIGTQVAPTDVTDGDSVLDLPAFGIGQLRVPSVADFHPARSHECNGAVPCHVLGAFRSTKRRTAFKGLSRERARWQAAVPLCRI